jgi:hypothetical protein
MHWGVWSERVVVQGGIQADFMGCVGVLGGLGRRQRHRHHSRPAVLQSRQQEWQL